MSSSDTKHPMPCRLPKTSDGKDYLPRVDLRESSGSNASERREIAKAYRSETTGPVPSEKLLRAFQNLENSRKEANSSDTYRFILKVAGFANESYSKLWDDKDKAQYSVQTLSSQTRGFNIDDGAANKSGMSDQFEDQNLYTDRIRSDTVDSNMTRALGRPTVKGYMFLTPTAYAHLLESHELLKQHCHTSLELDEFVCNPKYSTYFARLMATRIQLSRFLGGKYYSAQSNYNRLMQVNNRLIQWFKSNLQRTDVVSGLLSEADEGLGYVRRLARGFSNRPSKRF